MYSLTLSIVPSARTPLSACKTPRMRKHGSCRLGIFSSISPLLVGTFFWDNFRLRARGQKFFGVNNLLQAIRNVSSLVTF